jgi:hypothetical protein
VQKLEAAIRRAVADPAVHDKLNAVAYAPDGRSHDSIPHSCVVHVRAGPLQPVRPTALQAQLLMWLRRNQACYRKHHHHHRASSTGRELSRNLGDDD